MEMRNLLHADLSERDIAEILAATAGRPALPPMDDPAWDRIRANPITAKWLKPCVERAVVEAGKALPELTDELYSGFFRTGERLPFEKAYFERRRRLGRASVALLLGGRELRDRLLTSWIHMLDAVSGEESWSLPAHVWTRPDGKDPMTIDLMAAETANNLAEILVVFGNVVPPDLSDRIRKRLRVRVFENYLDRKPPFHWTELPMNWNAVCHQGVLGAALAIEQDHAFVARMLARAARHLPVFLSGFGDDGSTSEGPAYWSYGFGRFSELNTQLEHRTRGGLSLFHEDGKIARIARFAPLMTFSGGRFVNFSDGPATGWLSPALLADLGRRLHDPLLHAHAAACWRHLADAGVDLDELRGDFFHFSRLALRAPAAEALAATPAPVQPDVFFEDYGAVVARGTDRAGNRWEFAAKAGHNGEHHNHNDCGSFILNVNGRPAVIEIGAPEYVGDYFNSDATRYTFLAARSLGHSVPLINDCEQSPGATFAARVLECELGTERVRFVMDLTKTYPAKAGCRSLVRTLVFHKSTGGLEVRDAFELDSPGMVESIVICGPPPDDPSRLVLTPLAGTRFIREENCAYNDHAGRGQTVRRLRFGMADPARSAELGFRIDPRAGDTPKDVLTDPGIVL